MEIFNTINYKDIKNDQEKLKNSISGFSCFVFPILKGKRGEIYLQNKKIICELDGHIIDNNSTEEEKRFSKYINEHENFTNFFNKYEVFHIAGIWLLPDTEINYDEKACFNFYINEIFKKYEFGSKTSLFVFSFNTEKQMLEDCGLAPLIIPGISLENDIKIGKIIFENHYLIKKDGGIGAGIEIRNYDNNILLKITNDDYAKSIESYTNKKNSKSKKENKKSLEEKIINKFLTQQLLDKEKKKIFGKKYNKKYIKLFLEESYQKLITKNIWNITSNFNFPTIDFTKMKRESDKKIKELYPEIFKKGEKI